MKKKLLALCLALATIVIMASCARAEVTTNLTIKSMEGAGTKTISFKIHKDADTVIEETTNEDGTVQRSYTIYNNSTYFPKGYAAFMDWYIGTLPAEDKFYYEIDEASDPDYLFINFKYDFTTYEDYAKKTRHLAGEERWTKSAFVDPQLFVYKVEDPLDVHYNDLAIIYGESNFTTQACVSTMLENAISQAAVDAGVYAPYGDAGDNPDCKANYKDNHGISDETKVDETFKEYADVQYHGVPSNVSAITGNATYVFEPFNDEYTETKAGDAMRMFYVPDDGTYTLTDVTPFLPEGATEGKLYCDGSYLYVLTANEEEPAEDAAWIDGFTKKKITLGKKTTDRVDPEGEFGVLEGKNLGLGGGKFPWLIVGIAGGVVVIAAVIVIVAVVLKKKNEADDDDEDDDEDEEESEEETTEE